MEKDIEIFPFCGPGRRTAVQARIWSAAGRMARRARDEAFLDAQFDQNREVGGAVLGAEARPARRRRSAA
jgi:hypothetical protein